MRIDYPLMDTGTGHSVGRSQAAKKAWATIKRRKRDEAAKSSKRFIFETDRSLRHIKLGGYITSLPVVKHSRLTSEDNGGIGKDLSEGWAANYAIGCTHACTFCYVDSIHRRYRGKALGFAEVPWGHYLYVPSNLVEAIETTKWSSWAGKEVMLSSTHDPYLPQLARHTRRILELALPEGVRFCIQTRSPLVRRDLDLLEEYRAQVRIQVSIATMDKTFARAIEPRVAPPEARLAIIEDAKVRGLPTGIIIAPVFPPVNLRRDPEGDIEILMRCLAKLRPDHIYGECLHARGSNLAWTEHAIGELLTSRSLRNFDVQFQDTFQKLLAEHGLKGEWWPEHRH